MDSYSIQGQQNLLCFMAAWGSSVEARLPSDSDSCPRLSKYLIKLDEIKFDGTIFRLNAPVWLTLYVEDEVWYCENIDFSSLSFGSTAVQAVRSFCEDFSVLWGEIAKAPDETLASDAQRVKQALLSAVKTVETERVQCR